MIAEMQAFHEECIREIDAGEGNLREHHFTIFEKNRSINMPLLLIYFSFVTTMLGTNAAQAGGSSSSGLTTNNSSGVRSGRNKGKGRADISNRPEQENEFTGIFQLAEQQEGNFFLKSINCNKI